MKLIDFENNVPEKVAEWEDIGKFLGIDVSEEDVWEIARQSEEIPAFHNIYMCELASGIASECRDKYKLGDEVIDYYINSLDSHLYIDSIEAHTRDDFFGYLAKHLLQSVCIDENEEIDEDFQIGDTTFETGTPITEVWQHIEEHFNITIGEYIGA